MHFYHVLIHMQEHVRILTPTKELEELFKNFFGLPDDRLQHLFKLSELLEELLILWSL